MAEGIKGEPISIFLINRIGTSIDMNILSY